MSDKGAIWLQNAVADGLAEWAAVRASEGLPIPDEVEQAIYRLAFAAGADAGITRVARILANTSEEDA